MNETMLMPLVALTIGGGVVSSLFIGGLIPGTFPYLSRQIRSLSKQERMSGLQGLGRLGSTKATNLLITILNHHELDMRRVAVESLAMTGSQAAIEPLGTVLSDANPFIRRAAAMGLASFDEPRATEFLCQALKDSDEQVVAASALALAHRKDPAAIEPLCRALSGNPEISRVIAKALEKYGMEAFETLCRLLPEAVPEPVAGAHGFHHNACLGKASLQITAQDWLFQSQQNTGKHSQAPLQLGYSFRNIRIRSLGCQDSQKQTALSFRVLRERQRAELNSPPSLLVRCAAISFLIHISESCYRSIHLSILPPPRQGRLQVCLGIGFMWNVN